MRFLFQSFACTSLTCALLTPLTAGLAAAPAQAEQNKTFQAFTGKIKGSKVRIRLQANLDGPVLRQASSGELFVILGETDDFYVIAPPKDAKGYVYRTLILDNIVEGSRVNVRLEPHLESPVIAQLNQGDHVIGETYALNAKWMEISPPAATRFYISKDYVERVGEANYLAQQERREAQVKQAVQELMTQVEIESKTPYESSSFEAIKNALNHTVSSYPDFPTYQEQVKTLVTQLQEEHLQKKTLYLERQARLQQEALVNRSQQIESYLSQKEKQIEERQRQIVSVQQATKEPEIIPVFKTSNSKAAEINPRLLAWRPVEERLFLAWQKTNPGGTYRDFYEQQHQKAVWLHGTLEPYARQIDNKPGDYVLVNSQRLPIAYLYSTMVDLENLVGKQISVEGVERPNNQFTYKAFYVLSAQ